MVPYLLDAASDASNQLRNHLESLRKEVPFQVARASTKVVTAFGHVIRRLRQMKRQFHQHSQNDMILLERQITLLEAQEHELNNYAIALRGNETAAIGPAFNLR